MPYDWKTFRPALRRAILRVLVLFILVGGYMSLFHPKSPLPDEWQPLKPLDVSAPVTLLTNWKLRRALSSEKSCLAALSGAKFQPMPPAQDSAACFIDPRVSLTQVGQAGLSRVETRCQTALRLAMWERHGLQAAAMRHLGQPVTRILHFSSYSCRQIRTPDGTGTRMSSHATADAIDISGFQAADGSNIILSEDWTGGRAKARFLRDAFQSACLWFRVALGPNFNALHADHFHLQGTGWGLCR